MKQFTLIFSLLSLGFFLSGFTNDMNDCVGTMKYIGGMTPKGAAKICVGVKDIEKLEGCVGRTKHQQNMFDEEDIINTCAQSAAIRVI